MKSTKKSTKRTEEYRIHLEQSLHYRRRCRASYALFKELQEKNLLTIDEPFKSQIEAVIAPEPKTECEKKYDEKNEIKWNNYFQQYKQYCDALTTLSQNGQTVVFPSSSMTYFTDLSSQSFNKIWLFRQRDKFAKKYSLNNNFNNYKQLKIGTYGHQNINLNKLNLRIFMSNYFFFYSSFDI